MTTSTQLQPIDEVRGALTRMAPEFQKALPKHVSVEKFQRVVMTALQGNPDLLLADRRSLFMAATRAAQMGLLPDSREGAIVVFKGKAQFMPMIGGVLKLIRNSGELASIDALTVHQNDKFTYRPGIDAVPLHEPDWFGDRGEVIGVYAVARMKDGAAYVEVMNLQQITKARNVSRAKDNGPWVQWWDEMARKTVLLKLGRRLPMSTDLDETLRSEYDDLDNSEPAAPRQAVEPAQPPARTSRPSRLQAVAEAAPVPPHDEDGVIIDATAREVPPADDDSPI